MKTGICSGVFSDKCSAIQAATVLSKHLTFALGMRAKGVLACVVASVPTPSLACVPKIVMTFD